MDNYPKILIYLQNWSRPISRVLSRTTIHLGRTSPYASSDLPGPNAGRALGSLFGLAPGGVYPAAPVTGNAVRSYRTFSPLPRIAVRQPRAVCFLWHFPSAHAAQTLSGTLPCGARTFLPFLAKAAIAWPTPARIVAKFATARHGLFCRHIKIEDMQIVILAYLNGFTSSKGNAITG